MDPDDYLLLVIYYSHIKFHTMKKLEKQPPNNHTIFEAQKNEKVS